eukprot:TRINITY_DN834_c0_g1_i4.p1 TRINITY_DN834_c0_g1~~TRINITY_DN834_c0_g1_i4.p1  ORF type:complete len:461 (-),score=55.55 TRINITY_DN834_c0_g1_i4:129-1511(-)
MMEVRSLLVFLLLVGVAAVSADTGPKGPTNKPSRVEIDAFVRRLNPLSPLHPPEHTHTPPLSLKSLPGIDRFTKRQQETLKPVVIVPCLVGNAFDATLHDVPSKYWYCERTNTEWFRLFLNMYDLYPLLINCWFERFTLGYNATSHSNVNATGVEVRVPNYGGLDSIAYLDTDKQLGMWNTSVQILTDLGYQPGLNLRGAPYDWRTSTTSYPVDHYPRLKGLIEDTYRINGNRSVVVTSLSMGGAYFLGFLNTYVTQEWKDTYLDSWVSMDGAFGGSTSALASVINPGAIFGDSDFFSEYPQQWLSVFRTMGSLAFMLPMGEIYGEDTVFIVTPSKNYTAAEYVEVLLAAGANTTAQIMRDVLKQGIRNQKPPGIAVHCVYGYNVTTPYQLNYTKGFDSVPSVIFSTGDGTVLHEGLDRCAVWSKQQRQRSVSYPIQHMMHGSSVQNKQALAYFVSVLFN